MGDRPDGRLLTAIDSVVAKVRKYQDRGLGEQNTKASLIEPVLEALGWDIRDPDEVHREFKPTSKDCPVDYALKLLRKPRLFVEAKGLGETLSDRKWIAQVLGYATVAGVEWCVLADGNEYRFYNATAPVDADEKLFCVIKLSEVPPTDAVKTLGLISRGNMEENLLDVLWNAHFVDRHVKLALQEMFATADRGLIRLIRRAAAKLGPKEIGESLRRLDLRVESLAPVRVTGTSKRADTVSAAAPKRKKAKICKPRSSPRVFGITLPAIIAAGVLSPPLKLFRKYRKKVLEARLLSDGSVEFQGERHKSCSNAAAVARGTITGRPMSTNGWDFWQYMDNQGKMLTLADARETYLRKQQ